MPWTNYHQHCYFCDGTDAPEVYVKEALRQNVGSFGFSSHAPVPLFVEWSIQPDRYNEYLTAIAEVKNQYADRLPIYVGLEIDYIPDVISPSDELFQSLDYRIGSVHLVDVGQTDKHVFWEIDGPSLKFEKGLAEFFDGDIRAAVGAYYQATRELLQHTPPDVLGHMDKVKMNNQERHFSESEPWYREEVYQTLEVAAQTEVIIEVNTRGVYKKKTAEPYPSAWVLERIRELNIPICLNADAHHPSEITKQFAETAALLQQLGFKELHVLTAEGWQPRPFTAEGVAL